MYTRPPLGDGSRCPLGGQCSSMCLAGTCHGIRELRRSPGSAVPLPVGKVGPQDHFVFADEISCTCPGRTVFLMSWLMSTLLPTPRSGCHNTQGNNSPLGHHLEQNLRTSSAHVSWESWFLPSVSPGGRITCHRTGRRLCSSSPSPLTSVLKRIKLALISSWCIFKTWNGM